MELTFIIGAPVRANAYLQAMYVPAHSASLGLAVQLAVWTVHQKANGRPRGPLIKKLWLILPELSYDTELSLEIGGFQDIGKY